MICPVENASPLRYRRRIGWVISTSVDMSAQEDVTSSVLVLSSAEEKIIYLETPTNISKTQQQKKHMRDLCVVARP